MEEWKDWFLGLEISQDIEEIHSLYETLKTHTPYGEYDIEVSGLAFKVSDSLSSCELDEAEIKEFIEYLDNLPVCNDLGVEIAREEHHANERG